MLGDKTVSIPCPREGWGNKIDVRLADLRAGNSVTCPKCDAKIKFTGDSPGEAISDLDEALRRLGRK